MQDFEKLKVWQKAHALAIDVHRLAGAIPRAEGMALAAQLRRSALSVPSNIAEGAGKGGDGEFRRYLQIAMGSASETAYHLMVARDLGFMETATYDDLTSRIAEVRRMATGLLKRIASRSPSTGR